MLSDKEIFVEWLRHAIKIDKTISGKNLAELVGISPSTISGWFGSKSKGPRIETRLDICEKLGVSYNKIVQIHREKLDVKEIADIQEPYRSENNKKIDEFPNQGKALLMNSLAVELASIDPDEIDEVIDFIKYRISKQKDRIEKKSTKKTS